MKYTRELAKTWAEKSEKAVTRIMQVKEKEGRGFFTIREPKRHDKKLKQAPGMERSWGALTGGLLVATLKGERNDRTEVHHWGGVCGTGGDEWA